MKEWGTLFKWLTAAGFLAGLTTCGTYTVRKKAVEKSAGYDAYEGRTDKPGSAGYLDKERE